MQADLVELRRTLSLHRMTVPASEGYEMPAASTRGLKRLLSAADDDGQDDDDANGREKQIVKERVEAWSQAQVLRRRWVSASCIRADRMSKEHLDNWWAKQTNAQQFQGVPGRSNRVFVLSGERWNHETGDSPWADEPQSTASLEMALDWMLERQGPCDTLLVFDGRSASIRATLERKMQKARHVSDIWIIYQPRREAGGRKVVFGSRNREVGWVSFPSRKPSSRRGTAGRHEVQATRGSLPPSRRHSRVWPPCRGGSSLPSASLTKRRSSVPPRPCLRKRFSTPTTVARCAGRK